MQQKPLGGIPQGPPILPKMMPTWPQFGSKWSQDGHKRDPKIDHYSDASWNRLCIGWILVDFWIAKWSQVGTKMGSKVDFSENMKKCIWSYPATAKLGSGDRSWK